MPIQISNVLLVCPSCGKPTRSGARFGNDGAKERFCKKCGAALVVTEAGLEIDAPASAAARPVAVDDVVDVDEGEVVSSRRGKTSRRGGGINIDPIKIFHDFGGIATVLFGFGAFLVIVFLFMPIIGTAAIQRAQGTAVAIVSSAARDLVAMATLAA